MEKQVEFKVGNEILQGSLFIPNGNGPFPGVVFYHGRGSSRKRYLEISKRLADRGFTALAFDFRGCGESDGKFEDKTQRMGTEDARAGLEFILGQNVDRNRIGIMGTSFGGFVTALIIPDFSFVKSIVLRVPAIYPDEILDIHVINISDYSNIDRERWESSAAFKGITTFKGDLLVIQSEKDEVVDPWIVQKYFNDANKTRQRKLVIQKGAGHNLRENKPALEEFYKITFDWFIKTL